jgi:hypothetical protein
MASANGARTARLRRKKEMESLDPLTRDLWDMTSHPVIHMPTGVVVDFAGVSLKPDHEKRPFWVTPIGRIFLEGAQGRCGRCCANAVLPARRARTIGRPHVRAEQPGSLRAGQGDWTIHIL